MPWIEGARVRLCPSGTCAVIPPRLYVCQTCVRDRPLAPGALSQGRLLSDAIERALAATPLARCLALRRVNCLNGCLNPCNVALRAPDKHHLRFSRMTPAMADAVVEFAARYLDSPDGVVPSPHWPAPLVGRQTVCTPPA